MPETWDYVSIDTYLTTRTEARYVPFIRLHISAYLLLTALRVQAAQQARSVNGVRSDQLDRHHHGVWALCIIVMQTSFKG